MPQELPLPPPGAIVRARGRCWRVVDAASHGACGLCRLADLRSPHVRHLSLLVPFDRLVPVPPHPAVSQVGRRRAVHELASRLARVTPDAGLRASSTARFDLMPYQLEPALATLRGETRLLVADEVGLGKTIEAGIILSEIFARDPSARCLVAAPASLCAQWVGELRDRFGLPALHIDRAALWRLACLLPPGSLVWDQQALSVTSFDFIKRPEVRRGLEALRWDVLVVDEAHMASVAPERAAVISALGARARRVVLLTATPHASDSEGFEALCNIGRAPGEQPILLFRRTRADVGIASTRRTRLLRVRTTPAERRMHDALDRYAAEVWRQAGGSGHDPAGARLAMIVLRKRAASGPSALLASLSRRLAFLQSSADAEAACQLMLPLDPDEELDAADDEPSRALAVPGFRDAAVERRKLAQLLELARHACAADSKLAALARLVRRTREPVIIFTEYRDTLSRLAAQLPFARPPALLHGGVDQVDRQAAIRAFTDGETSILLATDAAAHGLNLQARCRLVVNVELPWMPSRLEQRAGRVDRIGQSRIVHVVHLVGRRTSEAQVLAKLVLRVERERAALGDLPAGPSRVGPGEDEEMDVARAVFEDVPLASLHSEPPADRLRLLDLRSEASEERARVESIRSLLEARSKRDASRRGTNVNRRRLGACWSVVRRRRSLSSLPPGLLCLFEMRFVDGRGSLVEDSLLLLHVHLVAAILPRRLLRRALPGLLDYLRLPLQQAAAQCAAQRASVLRSRAREQLASLASREAAIRDRADDRGAVQAGLFDRRAMKRADEDRRQRSADCEEEGRRLDALERATQVEAVEPALVLVLGLAL